MRKRINLELDRPEESAAVFKALASPERLLIMKSLIGKGPGPGLNISELAEKFNLPVSTVALHVRVLEEAGLIYTQEKTAPRGGTQKICIPMVEDVHMNFINRKMEESQNKNIRYSMPLGNYFDCSVTRPCGMAGRRSFIGVDDFTQVFYSSSRIHAQIVWFTSGFLEYRFPNYFVNEEELVKLSFTFEACSEVSNYNNDWPSDITVWINGHEIFTFRSPGDFGGKRGILNPDWWPDECTQYGELHQLDITPEGCFGDERKSSDSGFQALKIKEGEFISFKIGVKEDAEYVGGINLFGEHFGNYKQDIIMTGWLER